ncbi:hypothetical protein SLEP1_g8630 [Rubroshorea leprosula]|uniref:Uncharacterized protein n=1 Tax=Rubroshorea leprosula TaxID=152421 RepID=A0AAV5IC55_9ROSI|nr:hypothetical protein SLEP1_g8630 [Rubroshorea leprosula]
MTVLRSMNNVSLIILCLKTTKSSSSAMDLTRKNSASPKLLEIGCPYGTVPIKRTSKEKIIRAKTFMNGRMANVHPTAGGTTSFHCIHSIPHYHLSTYNI